MSFDDWPRFFVPDGCYTVQARENHERGLPLALIMLASMKWHIPELLTGLIGIALIVLSVWSSIRYSKTQAAN